jgi:hypothetical protein
LINFKERFIDVKAIWAQIILIVCVITSRSFLKNWWQGLVSGCQRKEVSLAKANEPLWHKSNHFANDN